MEVKQSHYICFSIYGTNIILQKVFMTNPLKVVLTLLLVSALVQSHPNTPAKCPINQGLTTVHHGHLAIGIGSMVSLQVGVDSLCYEYPLPSPFQQRPGVALAVSRFEANPSQQLFFSIQTSNSDSLSKLSFLLRTQWKYTHWNMLRINFFAEDSLSYEANSFMIDTTALAGCSSSKEVNVIIPYKQPAFAAIKAVAFLNGFEISISGSQPGVTPFEVQIMNVMPSNGGVSLKITATTTAKIYTVFVSVIAWSVSAQYVLGDVYQYTSFAPVSEGGSGIVTGDESAHDIFGFSGFIVSAGQFLLSAEYANQRFSFTVATTFQYLTFSYFFINSPPCSECPGYPYPYNGICQAQCPPGTVLTNGVCITTTIQCPPGTVLINGVCTQTSTQCPPGYYWNGTACVIQQQNCPAGTYWNGTACVVQQQNCPPGTKWNGTACCIQINNCPPGTYWNGQTCVSHNCPPGTYWNGTACAIQQQNCPPGTYWNGTACVIQQQNCPPGTYWNGENCVPQQQNCPPGTKWNGTACCPINTNCPPGLYWNGQTCVPTMPPTQCQDGKIWSQVYRKCVCPQGTHWNSFQCIRCPQGQYWSQQTMSCSCPQGQYWSGRQCIQCTGNRIWNPLTRSCICPNDQNWDGARCMRCPSGQFWNGFSCQGCRGGQIWSRVNMNCQCRIGYQWDGDRCMIPCPSGQISIGGRCQCPPNTYMRDGRCVSHPKCPRYQTWNGSACIPTSCPAGFFWDGDKCSSDVGNCPAGTYWDGYTCVSTTNRCPPGTRWNGFMCMTNTTQCEPGSYWNGQRCITISSRCPPFMNWVNGRCVPKGKRCPPGTYFNGQTCVRKSSCPDGKIWDQTLSQCVCPRNSFWNGRQCFRCSGGQIYQGSGCFCPEGLFWDGNKCSTVDSGSCRGMENSIWNRGRCDCKPGFYKEGRSCLCNGLANNGFCDRCYMKPNSQWRFGQCQCRNGFYQFEGQCRRYRRPMPPGRPNPPGQPYPPGPYPPGPYPPGPPNGNRCNVANYWDQQQKRCLPCSDGCLSCLSCYDCTQCRPGYTYNRYSQRCTQDCGDGLRFTLACDDNNNIDGDGCSADCRIEPGYHCVGGSPNSKDTCSQYLPTQLAISQSGQSHIFNKIVINVRVNYLPKQLIESCVDCKNTKINCQKLLDVNIISGDKGCSSIKIRYIPTTSYSFSIEFDFGREPIGMFTAQIGVSQRIAYQYFNGIDTSQRLDVEVNPAFMSRYTGASEGEAKSASGAGKGDVLE